MRSSSVGVPSLRPDLGSWYYGGLGIRGLVLGIGACVTPHPPRAQEPAMFDHGTWGQFCACFAQKNSTAERGICSCT